MTVRQMRVLEALRDGPLEAPALYDRAGVSSRVLARLRQARLIEGSGDKNHWVWSITASGRAALTEGAAPEVPFPAPSPPLHPPAH